MDKYTREIKTLYNDYDNHDDIKENCEHTQFNEFIQLMKPSKKLFADLGVDFDIYFYTSKDFLFTKLLMRTFNY